MLMRNLKKTLIILIFLTLTLKWNIGFDINYDSNVVRNKKNMISLKGAGEQIKRNTNNDRLSKRMLKQLEKEI